MRHRDDHRDRYENPPKKKRGGFAVTIFAIAVFAFGLLGMIGLFGDVVAGFLQGAFGFVGYAFFALAIFYWIIDVRGWRRWAFFFRVHADHAVRADQESGL